MMPRSSTAILKIYRHANHNKSTDAKDLVSFRRVTANISTQPLKEGSFDHGLIDGEDAKADCRGYKDKLYGFNSILSAIGWLM